jgi:hypothetical protein
MYPLKPKKQLSMDCGFCEVQDEAEEAVEYRVVV